jgi:hypothetical protein
MLSLMIPFGEREESDKKMSDKKIEEIKCLLSFIFLSYIFLSDSSRSPKTNHLWFRLSFAPGSANDVPRLVVAR